MSEKIILETTGLIFLIWWINEKSKDDTNQMIFSIFE